MKIGIVCPYNIAKGGGVQEVVRELCDGLNRNGHEVKIITPLPKDTTGANLNDIIFIGGSADIYSPLGTVAQVSGTISTDLIDEILEREKFDVLHFHEPWVPVVSRQILARSPAVNVATFHAKLPDSLVSQSLVKAVTPYLKSSLKYIDYITAPSAAAADHIGKLTTRPIRIIPNGIKLDTYKFRAEDKVSDHQTILFIGRLEKRKGVKYLIRAFNLLKQQRSNIQLLIAGDGPDRDRLESMVEELGTPDVNFLGYVTEAEKHKLLESADVFCSPALFGESFGIVLLEAIASGVPVVAGDNPGYISVMKGTGRLSLVSPKDTAEFARRLDTFLAEPAVRQVWRAWAKDYIKQYAYPEVIQLYETAYRQALKGES